MKFTHIFDFLRKKDDTSKSSPFADFFLHASDDKKKQVFREAAKKANEEQMEAYIRSSRLNQKTT